MPALLTTIAPYLKERYAPKIRRQLSDETVALARIEQSSANISSDTEGKYVTFPVHVRRNSGIGSRLENDPLPQPGNQGYASARVNLKHAYGGIEVTGQAIDMADSDPKSFARTIEEETSRLKDDLRKDLNRQLYGDGTGAISTVRSAGTGVNIVPVADAKLFQLNEIVDIITVPSTVAVAARTITSVDLTAGANTITLSGATFNVAVGQLIVRKDSVNKEITGYGSIIGNTGTLYNISSVTEPEWKSVVRANGGTARQLTEGLMTEITDQIRTNGGKTTLILYSLGVRRSYANLLMQLRQTTNTTAFKGGFSALAFTTDRGEIPVVADPDAPIGSALFINEDALTFYRDAPWRWLDRDGSMWKQTTDSSGVYDKWYAHLVERHELATDRRNTHGKLTDLIES
jgi:hypothetical protein